MYKLCKSEQSAQRQREMEHQLLKMMETLRFDEITVTDLCSRAGYSRKAFYRYFSGKDGALYALIDHTLWELESFSLVEERMDAHGSLAKMTSFFHFWKKQKQLLDALSFSGINNILAERMLLYSGTGTLQRFLTYSDMDVRDYATVFGVNGIVALLFRWHGSGYQQTPEQIAEIAWNLLTKPLIFTM